MTWVFFFFFLHRLEHSQCSSDLRFFTLVKILVLLSVKIPLSHIFMSTFWYRGLRCWRRFWLTELVIFMGTFFCQNHQVWAPDRRKSFKKYLDSLVLKPLFPVYIMLSLLAVSEIFKRKAFQAPLVLGPGSVERGPGRWPGRWPPACLRPWLVLQWRGYLPAVDRQCLAPTNQDPG